MGPSSLRGTPIYGADYDEANSTFPGNAAFYLMGNIDGRRRSQLLDERLFMDPQDWKYVAPGMIGSLSVLLYSPVQQALGDVMEFAGAFPRDAADQRVINQFQTCRGRIIDSPAQVGGWPALANGTGYTDSDSDGMADSWEAARSMSDPNADADSDGYTNLEEFLNELAGDQDANGAFINKVGTGFSAAPPVNCNLAVS
jgi:pectate lyase